MGNFRCQADLAYGKDVRELSRIFYYVYSIHESRALEGCYNARNGVVKAGGVEMEAWTEGTTAGGEAGGKRK